MARDAEADEPERISQLLADWANRDPAAREQLVPIVYEELRRLAHHYMRGERSGHTLQTTALVNEVYMRLAGIDALQWRDRAHFFAMAATLMRRVLVDYARQRARDKRGAGVSVTSLDENALAPQPAVDVVALDEALEQFAAVDPQPEPHRRAQVLCRVVGRRNCRGARHFRGDREARLGHRQAVAVQRAHDWMKTLDDWPRVKRVLEGALARDGADRQAYLAEACGKDTALRARIDVLLAAGDRVGNFLETPAAVLLEDHADVKT